MSDPLRCLIVEDESLPAELLAEYVRQTPGLVLSGICPDAIFALEWLNREPVDVLFLDIHLPQLKGLDMLALLSDPPLVVITTAYHEYALQGYRFEVVDYLLKPVDYPRFLEAADKLRRRLMPPTPPPQVLVVNVNKRKVRIPLSDIIYMESLKEYCRIYTSERSWLTQATLTQMEQRLPAARFLRIHRSYIVHLEHITTYNAAEVILGEVVLPIGRTYKSVVLSPKS
ncbi:MAG: LytTR family transcriptional regulator DNA-binding domain-containing protein [Bacteroidetes bacterium]|nr:LytTR family transcriptional regulator DNA-binding domain-containing protein [Bacteroidota bacterium]